MGPKPTVSKLGPVRKWFYDRGYHLEIKRPSAKTHAKHSRLEYGFRLRIADPRKGRCGVRWAKVAFVKANPAIDPRGSLWLAEAQTNLSEGLTRRHNYKTFIRVKAGLGARKGA